VLLFHELFSLHNSTDAEEVGKPTSYLSDLECPLQERCGRTYISGFVKLRPVVLEPKGIELRTGGLVQLYLCLVCEFLTDVMTKIQVFWDRTPCRVA
jgi:hypothetical protein